MNQDQLNHLNMYNAVVLSLNDNSAIYSSNTVFSNAVTAFKGKVSAVNSLQIGQINNSKGITLSKEQVKTNLINLTLAHADAGRAYAASVSNTSLQQSLKITPSELERMPDAELVPTCQNIYNIVNPLVASLSGYGVNTASLLALQTAYGSFGSLVGKPKTARSSAKAYTTALEQQLAVIQTFLDETLDPLMTQYKTTQEVFYESYFANRKLQPAGHRTTVTITGVITDASNHPILKAHVSLLSTTRKKKVTKADGKYKFCRLKVGTYTVQVIANGMVLQTKSITVSVAKTITLDFTMVATTGGTTGGGGGATTGGSNTQ